MGQTSAFQFTWGSTLGYSVILFLVINFLYLVLGLATPLLYPKYGLWWTGKVGLVYSPESDVKAFGKPGIELAKEHPEIMTVKTSVYQMYFGMYLAVAILHFCLVWFGLREGEMWSLWALTLSDLSIIVFFLMGAYTFSTNLAPLGFTDLAPYAMIPVFILPFAAVLGWVGLR